MDDSLEQPNVDLTKALVSESGEALEKDEEGQSSGDEDDGGLDWTKLSLGGHSVSRPVIPKRGDKEYEPKTGGMKGEGSGLQRHYLDRARGAMFDALRATRTISSKSISYGVWYPGIARVHVTLARGNHIANIGHSVPRPALVPAENGSSNVGPGPVPMTEKIQRRLELLPEEALYLVERGAMFCWKEHHLFSGARDSEIDPLEGMEGSPMSVQQAFAEMIGKEDLTLEKYQVYSYLKRLGYVVTRTKPPTDVYPTPPPYPSSLVKNEETPESIFKRIFSTFKNRFLHFLRGLFTPKFDWWKPIRINRWLGINMDYRSIFRSLRFIPTGHDIALKVQRPTSESRTPSPYEFFFNLYKPTTPYKKTSPPLPDFAIAVVNARTTPMPSLAELTALFDVLPELPPPVPRRRQQTNLNSAPAVSRKPAHMPKNVSLLKRIFSWTKVLSTSQTSETHTQRKTNSFMALKAGKKSAVIAVVDAGTPSFFRFGQGAFDMWPMLG